MRRRALPQKNVHLRVFCAVLALLLGEEGVFEPLLAVAVALQGCGEGRKRLGLATHAPAALVPLRGKARTHLALISAAAGARGREAGEPRRLHALMKRSVSREQETTTQPCGCHAPARVRAPPAAAACPLAARCAGGVSAQPRPHEAQRRRSSC